MTTKTVPTAEAQSPATAATIRVTDSGREALKLYEQEIATYLCELPRLLAEGHAGRHALVKGDEVLSVWDTQGDALQAGRERFGIEPIFVKTIDSRDSERFALLHLQKDL
jgi:asparagine synthetase B (glutamine-hydrolysing)